METSTPKQNEITIKNSLKKTIEATNNTSIPT